MAVRATDRYAAIALTAVLVTLVRLVARSVAPFPFAPNLQNLTLSFLLYALSLAPAVVAVSLGPRFARLANLLLGAPFGLLAISLLVAGGNPSRISIFFAGVSGFPIGVLLNRFASTRLFASAITICLTLGVGIHLRAAAASHAGGPSVLFVVLDTTAAGHLSAYGYPKPTTPSLEALARRSLVYRRAISPAPWTVPAHASIFSGLYPSQLGFNGINFDPQDAVGSLAADVELSGWTADAISANPLVAKESVLRAGYRAVWEGTRLSRPFALQLLDRVRGYQEFVTNGDDITSLAIDWVDRLAPRGEPWFLFLNYVDPHFPYRPPPRERDEFAPGVDPDRVEDLIQPCSAGQVSLSPEVTARMRALYDGEVAAMDRALGRLLGELARRGYGAENLLVIVTADHGEALGERGVVGHMRGLPDTVLHVPLMITGPGVTPGVITTPVQTVQLRATVRALLGMPPLSTIAPALPPWGKAPSLLITEHPEPRWYLDALRSCDDAFDLTPWAGNWVAVERDGVKVVFDESGHGGTYRLERDPEEKNSLPLSEGAALVQAYAAWHQREWFASRGLPAESRSVLESMGYVH